MSGQAWVAIETERDDHGYIACLVTQDEPGYLPMRGNPAEFRAPWYLGTTIEQAREQAEAWNRRDRDMGPREAALIVASSMWAQSADKRPIDPAVRLEAIRESIQAENVSYGELAGLADLADHIDPGDVELLEWAGVPEFPEEADDRTGTLYATDDDGCQTDRPLAWFHPAGDEAVQTVLNAPLDDDGRSEWRWYRLVNGDLILGIAPHGDTYFAVELDAETPR